MDPEKVELDDEGVTVSSPDTPEQDVSPADEPEHASMAEAVEAAMKDAGDASGPGTEDAEGQETAGKPTQDPKANGKEAEGSSGTEDGALPEGDPTEEEMKNYSQKATARIRGLVEERNQAAKRAERVEPILKYRLVNGQ